MCVWCVVLVLVFGRGGVVCCVGGVLFCFFSLSLLSFSLALFLSFSLALFLSSLFLSFSLSLFLSFSLSLFLSFSLSFFFLSFFSLLSLFSLLSSLPLPLLSPLLATKHCGKNRSTNTAANFEAFECDLAHGRCTAVGSLPPSLPSLLPSLPLLARDLFLLQFKINSEKSPPVKLQALLLHINLKTIELQRVKTVIMIIFLLAFSHICGHEVFPS